jgi:hypothetical protein
MIDELPEAPDPATDTPQVFSQKAAASVLAQRALPGQINAAIAELGALAAGGAYAFPYVFDSTISDADPGPGKLRLSSATQNASTALRIDVLSQSGVSLAGVFDALQAVTSAIKGAVRIVKQADPTKWLLFDLSTIGTGAGYRNIALTYRAGSGASPFANGDALMVYLDRNGDSGTVPGATELLADIPISASTVFINALNIFDTSHDSYLITLNGISFSGPNSSIGFTFAVNGVVDTSSSYTTMQNGAIAGATLAGVIGLYSGTGATEVSGVIEISSINFASRIKAVTSRLMVFANGQTSPYQSVNNNGFFNKPAASPTGFSLNTNFNGQFVTGSVRIYGVRKS